MRNTIGLWMKLAFTLMVLVPTADAQSPVGPVSRTVEGTTAFVNVAVIPMDTERVLPNYTVLVAGGRITALGPNDQVKVPAEAVRIDGRGKYLMPGLAEMHGHWWLGSTREMVERMLLEYLANGITTVRVVDWVPDSAAKVGLQVRARAVAGDVLSPRLYIGLQNAPVDTTPESILKAVRNYKAAGYDFIKVRTEALTNVTAIAAAARQVGLPVIGHLPAAGYMGGVLARYRLPSRLADVSQGLAAGMRSIEHTYGWASGDRMREQVAALKRAEAWACPTLTRMGSESGTKPESLERSSLSRPGQMMLWAMQPGIPRAQNLQLVKALQDSGVGLLLGSDDNIGRATGPHRELELFVSAGLTPYQALVAGTRNVAQYFGTLNETGTIAVGKRADLLLLAENPLVDIRSTSKRTGVMLGGRWLPQVELERRLAPRDPRQEAELAEWYLTGQNGAQQFMLDTTQAQLAAFQKLRAAYTVQTRALADSLGPSAPTVVSTKRAVYSAARFLGAYRALLTSAGQRDVFDIRARQWMEDRKQEGYQEEIPGVAPTP